MEINGYYIETCEDNFIERWDDDTGEKEICEGYYCTVYADEDCTQEVDYFSLAVGWEIRDMSHEELERVCRKYIQDLVGFFLEKEKTAEQCTDIE